MIVNPVCLQLSTLILQLFGKYDYTPVVLKGTLIAFYYKALDKELYFMFEGYILLSRFYSKTRKNTYKSEYLKKICNKKKEYFIKNYKQTKIFLPKILKKYLNELYVLR